MNAFIIQSSMNSENLDRYKHNYKEAREFMRLLPFDSWIRIHQLPELLKFPIIDMIDGGYYPEYQTAFDDTGELFLITRKISKEALFSSMIEARVIDLKNVEGF